MRRHKQMRKKWIQFLMPFSFYTWKKKLKQKTCVVTPFYNFVYGNQKFAFSKHLAYLMMVYSASYFVGCLPPQQNYSCTNDRKGEVTSLSLSPEFPQVGQACNFTAVMKLCDQYAYSWLSIEGPIDGNSNLIIYEESLPITLDYTKDFPHTFTQPGQYYVYFSISKIPYDPSSNWKGIYRSMPVTVVGNEMNNFRIIELSMVNDELWPNYSDQNANPPFNYNGKQKRNKAFSDAGTSIETVNEIKNLSAQIFTTNDDFNYWAIEKAGGDLNKPGYGLEYNTAIICGVDDVVPMIEGALGRAWPQGDFNLKPAPARVAIAFSRIRTKVSSDKDRTLVINGVTIHELGHARGIKLDGWNIVPPHGGTDLSHCIMWGAALPPSINPPDQTCDFFEPYFCQAHRSFIRGITWNPNLKIATEGKNVSD